jgi:hypothetical protein
VTCLPARPLREPAALQARPCPDHLRPGVARERFHDSTAAPGVNAPGASRAPPFRHPSSGRPASGTRRAGATWQRPTRGFGRRDERRRDAVGPLCRGRPCPLRLTGWSTDPDVAIRVAGVTGCALLHQAGAARRPPLAAFADHVPPRARRRREPRPGHGQPTTGRPFSPRRVGAAGVLSRRRPRGPPGRAVVQGRPTRTWAPLPSRCRARTWGRATTQGSLTWTAPRRGVGHVLDAGRSVDWTDAGPPGRRRRVAGNRAKDRRFSPWARFPPRSAGITCAASSDRGAWVSCTWLATPRSTGSSP